MRFQTSSNEQIQSIIASHPVILGAVACADRDFKLAEDLDKQADEYQANGNPRMATVCRARAVMACDRATKAISKVK